MQEPWAPASAAQIIRKPGHSGFKKNTLVHQQMKMLRYLPEISLGLELVQDPAFKLEFFSKYLAARCPRKHGSLHSVCIWNPVFSSMVPEKRHLGPGGSGLGCQRICSHHPHSPTCAGNFVGNVVVEQGFIRREGCSTHTNEGHSY